MCRKTYLCMYYRDKSGEEYINASQVLEVSRAIIHHRIVQKLKKSIQMSGIISLSKINEIVDNVFHSTKVANEYYDSLGDVMVDILEASMKDCFGLIALQQVIC